MKYDSEAINTLLEDMRKVPFGNSLFQIGHFIDGKESIERTFRNSLLNLSSKLDAIKHSELNRARKTIELEEKHESLEYEQEVLENFPSNSAADRAIRKLKIDIDEIEYAIAGENKLIEDAKIEVMAFYNTIQECKKLLPENFTRLDFEQAEHKYWVKRLVNDVKDEIKQIGRPEKGTMQSLRNMGHPVELIKNTETNQLEWNVYGVDSKTLEITDKVALLPETILDKGE